MSGECHDDACITCSDQLLSVVVDRISGDGLTAQAHADGTAQEISVELIDGVRSGDILLVHGGVALQRAPAGELRS